MRCDETTRLHDLIKRAQLQTSMPEPGGIESVAALLKQKRAEL